MNNHHGKVIAAVSLRSHLTMVPQKAAAGPAPALGCSLILPTPSDKAGVRPVNYLNGDDIVDGKRMIGGPNHSRLRDASIAQASAIRP